MARVFLSYAREDEQRATQLYEGLVARKIDVWFDRFHMKPGPWHPQILKAISQSRYFVACMSLAALNRLDTTEGYQDTELTIAFQIALNQPDNRFAIIPVRFENTHQGDHRLSAFHQYDLYGPKVELTLDRLAETMGGAGLRSAAPRQTASQTLADDELELALYGKATVLFEMGQFDRCLTVLESLERIYGVSFKTRSDTATALHAAGRYAEALVAVESALGLADDEPLVWFNKATIVRALGRRDEAEVSLRHGLRLAPGDVNGLLKLSSLLSSMDRMDEALDTITQALRVDASCAKAYAMRGIILELLKKDEAALEASGKAVSLDPTITVAHETMGLVLCRSLRFAEALAHLEKAIEMGSSLAPAHIAIVESLVALDRLEEADKAVDRALAADPHSFLQHHRTCLDALKRAVVLQRLDKHVEAAELLTPILARESDDLGDSHSLITALAWCLTTALGHSKPFNPEPFGSVVRRWLVWLNVAKQDNLLAVHRRIRGYVEAMKPPG